MAAEDAAQDVHAGISGIIAALAEVQEGDIDRRLDADLPGDHPLGALHRSINAVLDALADERVRCAGYRRELEERGTMLELQRAAIKELGPPIIEIWPRVLCVPVTGVIERRRGAEMMDALLQAVAARGARLVIIDITGIAVMDTTTADGFIRMASAIRLLGAECALSGMSPMVAETLAQMDITLASLATFSRVRDAIAHFLSPRR
jgi:rsbT co-antagonist protein RsbR